MRSRSNSGFSIPELLIVSAIFSLFLVLSYAILSQGLKVWNTTASSQDVNFQLQRARSSLQRDLVQASRVELLASGSQLWFLSSLEPATGKQLQHDDGRPFWQRNILYYMAKPLDHDTLFGVSCGTDEARCPHKVLVRKTMDLGAPTTPSSLAQHQESLMDGKTANALVLPPKDLAPIPSAAGVEEVEVVATGLLDLNFSVDPQGVAPGEIEVTLQGFDLKDAGKSVKFGTDDLSASTSTEEMKFSVFLPD